MSAKPKTKSPTAARLVIWKSSRARPGISGRKSRGWWLAASVVVAARAGFAQEALHSAWTGEGAAEARHRQLESQNYTFKTGDLKVLVTPSMSFQYNDNINLAETGVQKDFIISPTLSFDATYPISDFNILDLSLGASYNEYLEHNSLSYFSLNSSSTSGLSFGIVAKSFSMEVHDRVGYSENSQEAAVASTARYRNLNNSAGLLMTEDLNALALNLGYDHQNVISLSGQFQSQDSAAELVYASAGYRLNPRVLLGLDASGTFTTYDQAVLDNNNNYSAGVHAVWRPNTFFRITPRVGYTVSQFQQTATSQTPTVSSYYFDVTAIHDVSKILTYSVSFGREIRGGIQADVIQDYYFRPALTWSFVRNLSIQTIGAYEHGSQGGGSGPTIVSETYDYYSGTLILGYSFMKRLSSTLSYELTIRDSTGANRAYTQNAVVLNLAYHL
jgi:hypothetical protein